VCILDSDTIVNTNAFRVMADYLDSHREVGLVGPAMTNKNGDRQTPYRRFPTLKLKLYKGIPMKKLNEIGIQLESYPEADSQQEIVCDYLISACWLMPYSTFKEIGYFDENIFYSPEDVEYCIRCWMNNLSVVHLKQAEIIHIYQRISKKKLISRTNFSHLKCLLSVLYKYRHFLKKRRETQRNEHIIYKSSL